MIEKRFDVPFIAQLAKKEKQIQQSYRPIIAVHKWFARRPGTLFRGLLLSEFANGDLRDSYYRAHNLANRTIGDPFMGGGTPLFEANRVGCDIVGMDVNPMAYWIVRQEIESLDLDAYARATAALRAHLEDQVGALYRTRCLHCGSPDAHIKYAIWVKTIACIACDTTFDLFPGYLLAKNSRHPKHVLICSACGELNEIDDRDAPGACAHCGNALRVKGPATRAKCPCPACGTINSWPRPDDGPPQHRMVAIEYHCPICKPSHRGRFFKKPDADDLTKYDAAVTALRRLQGDRYAPDIRIPAGDETNRLLRWGYRAYANMFNARQTLGLELSCRWIVGQPDDTIRNALATNLSDLLRYQNMLCRYDTMALKSLDIFSVHGFPVGLVQCESNLLGISNGNGKNVGSGGWSNIVTKYHAAKAYCAAPFEFRYQGKRRKILIKGESIGMHRNTDTEIGKEKGIDLRCASSADTQWPEQSLDAVFTDPPYYVNVQYAELMDFCYVWLRQLVADDSGAFEAESTRNARELTGNDTMERDLAHFCEGMSATFQHMARALKPGGPLAFTYHHNKTEGYLPIIAAILDAGLVCTVPIPCPAEMGASIHISGTGSSVLDTVFVCRATGTVPRQSIVRASDEIANLVARDIDLLRLGGISPTKGDMRCLALGHLARLAIWFLRDEWSPATATSIKLARIAQEMQSLGGWEPIVRMLAGEGDTVRESAPRLLIEHTTYYGEFADAIPF